MISNRFSILCPVASRLPRLIEPRSGKAARKPPCARRLSVRQCGVSSRLVKEKWNLWLPVILMLVFALTRWPGLLPPNFSAFYALAFCAGVYFPKRLAWWLPLATMLVTDAFLNVFYYHTAAVSPFMLVNYVSYAVLIWLGQRYSPRSSWLALLAGGVLGAI